MKKNIFTFLILFSFLLIGCEKDEQVVKEEINKTASVEYEINSSYTPDSTKIVLATSIRFWKDNNQTKFTVSYDTLPALGKDSVSDDDGNLVVFRKEYDIFVTLKGGK
jgi:uncharacterized lipoprotein NlpE involved in copper resistance